MNTLRIDLLLFATMLALREKEKVGMIRGARLWILGDRIAQEFTGSQGHVSLFHLLDHCSDHTVVVVDNNGSDKLNSYTCSSFVYPLPWFKNGTLMTPK